MGEQISDNRRIAKNTVLLYARMFLVMLVSLYTVRVVLNVLGEVDYGIYNVVGGIVVMFAFLSRTLASASQRYFAYELGRRDYEKLNNVFSITLILYILIIIIILILAETLGLWFLHAKMTIPDDRMFAAEMIYQFSIVSFCFTILMTPYQALLIAREDMNVYAFVGVLEAVLYLIVAISLKIIPFDHLIVYGALMTVAALVVNSIYYIYSRVKYPESRFRKYWNPQLAKEITSYSGWNIFGAIANVLRSQGINILINMFFSPAINAARGLAYQVSGALNLFASNFYSAVRPQVTKKYAAGDINETNNLIFSSSKLSYYLILFLAVSVIVFIHPVLQLWLVDIPRYTELFVSLLIIVVLIDSLSNPLMTLVQATGRVKVYQLVVSILLIMNLPISWVLLKLGFPAEYTMYTAIAISFVLLFARVIILKRMVDFPAKDYVTSILSRVILSTALCFIVSLPTRVFIYDNTSGKFLFLALCVGLSVILNMAVIYIVGLNKTERTMIRKFVESKLKQK